MSRNLKLKIVELTDCPYPQLATYGKNPWIRISVNKTAVADVLNDGVTIFPGSPSTAHCTVKFKYEEVLNVPNAADTKLSIAVMDGTHVLTKASIRTKPLLRGIREEKILDLEPKGHLRLVLTAIDFGKIDKPTVEPIDVKVALPSENLLQTDALSSFANSAAKKRLRDYKDGEIKRDLPAIAQGTYGIVYTGTVKDHKNQKVAIKDIKVTDPKLFEEWKHEVEFMALHTCPYIVEVYGFAATEQVLTIVMEFADRGMLFDLLHKPKAEDDLTLVKRVRMARHCCLAVSFLHANNVLHRDIKSLNILVTKDWVGKLSDFGAAKLVPQGSNFAKHTQGRGTPLWMAPEVRRGHEYNLSADIFSLGVMLFEIFEVSLPLWDTQRETIVLPSYSFQSAPLVLPLLHMTPTNRPTASSVAKQIDFILSYILTGKDAHVGTSVVVDLDALYNIDDVEATKRLKAALQIIKDAKTAPQPIKNAPRSQSNVENDNALKPVQKKPLPQVPNKSNKLSEGHDRRLSDTPTAHDVHKKDSKDMSPRKDTSPQKDSKDKEKEHDKEREKDEGGERKRKTSKSKSKDHEVIDTPISPEPKRIEPLTQTPFTAGPVAVQPPQPQRLRRSSTPIEVVYNSSKTHKSNELESKSDDPTPQSGANLSKSEYHFFPSREQKQNTDANASERRDKDLSRTKAAAEPEAVLLSPRQAPPRPKSEPRGRAVMLYDFAPMNPGELNVKAGDRLNVLQVVDVWLEAVTMDGRRGWVPSNYIHYLPN